MLRKIGQGSQAKVYEAIDKQTGKPVALKVFGGAEFFAREDIEQIKHEFDLLQHLDNPLICKGYDLHKLQESLVLSMELVSGQSLYKLVVRHLPSDVTTRLLGLDQRQFAQLVQYYEGKSEDLLPMYQSFIRLRFGTTVAQSDKKDGEVSDESVCVEEVSEESFCLIPAQVGSAYVQGTQNQWYETATNIFLQLCDALVYLERQRVVHRDLKP